MKLCRPGLGISDLKDPVTLHTYLMWVLVETQSLSLYLSVSHCALACRMMNLYTWCWCQREWGTDGALRSEERLRTPIGRQMQPNTITDIHSLFLQLNYEYRTMFFWIGKWEIWWGHCKPLLTSWCFFLCLQNTWQGRRHHSWWLCMYLSRQNAN